MNGLEKLTKGEAEVLRQLASGMCVKEIAQARVTSVNTVRSQVKNMLAKLGVGTQLKAVAIYHRYQIIEVLTKELKTLIYSGDTDHDHTGYVPTYEIEHLVDRMTKRR